MAGCTFSLYINVSQLRFVFLVKYRFTLGFCCLVSSIYNGTADAGSRCKSRMSCSLGIFIISLICDLITSINAQRRDLFSRRASVTTPDVTAPTTMFFTVILRGAVWLMRIKGNWIYFNNINLFGPSDMWHFLVSDEYVSINSWV